MAHVAMIRNNRDLFLRNWRLNKKITNKAKTVRMIAKRSRSTNKVRITNNANENPTKSTVDDMPSRYMTRKKDRYTSANPVSLCRMAKTAGTRIKSDAKS
jgi:hypothetical protein